MVDCLIIFFTLFLSLNAKAQVYANAVRQQGTWNITSILNPVSVTGALTDAQLRANPIPMSLASVPTHAVTQSGTWDVSVNNFPAVQPVSVSSLPLPTGAATQLTLASVLSDVSTIKTTVTSNNNLLSQIVGNTGDIKDLLDGDVPVIGPLTDTQLRAADVGVSVSNFPATQAISGSVSVSNFPSSQAVTGPLTDTQLRATPVPVSGSVSISGTPSVSVSNFPGTQVVSGTVTANTGLSQPLTDTQLRATAVPVSLASTTISNFPSSFSVSNFPATQAVSGTVSVNSLPTGSNTIGSVKITDGTNVPSVLIAAPGSDTGQPALAVRVISQLGAGSGSSGGLTDTQLRASPVPVSLTSTTVSNFPATQAISAASLPLPSGASTSALQTTANTSLSSIDSKTPALGQALAAGSVPVVLTASQLSTLTPLSSVSVSNFPATQPVSGTVSISGTVTTNTGLTQPLTDTQLRATPVPVSGTVAFSNSTLAVTGPLTDTQLRASAVPVSLTSTTISNFPATQAVSAASLPLPTGAATETTLSAMNTKLPSLGQAVMASSQPVVIASNQSSIPVTSTDSGTKTTASTMPAGGVGVTGWLSAIYDRLAGTLNIETNAIWVKQATASKDTYIASNGTTAFTPVATATDMIQIRGSATKTIRVLDFVVCPSATAAGAQTMYLVKRSTANTGGTSPAAASIAAMDSTDAAVSGSVVQYSANATSLGTTVWTRPRRVMFQITAGTSLIEPCTNLLQYAQDNFTGEPVTLRGVAESLSLNNNAAALAAGYRIDSWYVIFTEE